MIIINTQGVEFGEIDMNKRIYKGIPYLGEDTPNMYKRIRNNIRFKTIHTTFYDMWYNLEPNRYLAIVDKQWLTWLDDIIFNYRDNKIMLPYYKYKYFDVILTPKKLDGNLIYNNGVLTITHSYNLCFKKLNIGCSLKIYDLKEDKFFNVIFDKLISLESFSMKALFHDYLVSCYYGNAEFEQNKAGYHFINQIKGVNNQEAYYRRKYDLIGLETSDSIENCRDVRNYTYNQFISMGYLEYVTNDNYSRRNLKFECFLYCVVFSKLFSSDCDDYNHYLKSNNPYFKYEKLIFKKYWINQDLKNKTIIGRRFKWQQKI